MPDVVPTVEFLDQGELCLRISDSENCVYVGFYEDDVIYLLDTMDMTTLKNEAYLVHETVHHMQLKSGKKYRCLGDMEKEAYDIQFEYLRQNKIKNPIDESGVGGIGYVLATQCVRR